MLITGSATTGAIELTSKQLIEVNKEQLQHGRRSDGSKITPSYRSAAYADEKFMRNPLAGKFTPDLYDTGSFYSSIRFFIQGSTINWEATDSKAPDLLAKYGSVLGVYENEPLIRYRQTVLYPLSIQIIKAETGL